MKRYTISREKNNGFCRLLQSLVGCSEISGILQYPTTGKEYKIDVRTRSYRKATIRGYFSDDVVRVEIDEEEETISQLLENYIKEDKILD
ncbi:MAG: hypothetical protein QMD14_00025 [Candidatus Aenigmarchaeota archaeon]|nr:hypothetical protein [Candidatus Aenigmarchaeota archaeon]